MAKAAAGWQVEGLGWGCGGAWGWQGPEGGSLLISPSRPASIKPSSVPVWVLGRRVCLPALFAFSWFREYVSGCPLPVSAPRSCFSGSWGCPRKCALWEERCPKLAFERRLPCVGWWLFFHPSPLWRQGSGIPAPGGVWAMFITPRRNHTLPQGEHTCSFPPAVKSLLVS